MSSSVSVPFLPGLRPAPLRAFGGVWRLTWGRFATRGQLFLLLGMIFLLGLLSLVRVRYGQESAYLPWTTEFYLGFILPVMAFLSGAAAMRDETKSTTTDYVLTRPIRRTHLVVFKYVSHLVCLQAFYLIVLGALLVLAMVIGVPDTVSAVPGLVAAQVTALACFSALGFFFGVLSSRYLVLGIVYAVAVEMAIGRIPTQLNRLSMTHQLGTILQPLNPGGLEILGTSTSSLTVVGLLLGEAVILVTLCALVFSRREWAGKAGRSA